MVEGKEVAVLMFAMLLFVIADACPNLPGSQLQVPDNYTVIEGLCLAGLDMVIVTPSEPPALPRSKPNVTLIANPKISLSLPMRPAVITLTLTITNADEKLWCPGIRWEFPDETKAEAESDCVPYDEADEKDIEQRSWTYRIRMPPGNWVVTAVLVRAGQDIQKKTVSFQVAGGH